MLEEFEMDSSNPVNDIIDSADNVALPSVYVRSEKQNVAAEVLSLVASANEVLPDGRKVGRFEAMEVLTRSLTRTSLNFANPSQRALIALREVSDFVNVAATGAQPKVSQAHTDLLPVGHPLSTRPNEFSADEVLGERAEWFASDPRIDEEFRPLVASAFKAPVNSLEREYVVAKLESVSGTSVPREVIINLQSSL